MYNCLEYSTDINVIGKEFPQIQKMKTGYNFGSPNSVYALAKHIDSIPPFQPELDGFVLQKKAKRTDLLSSIFLPSNGLIVSEKLMNILKNHTLPLHVFYPIKIYHNQDVLRNYYWLHIISDNTDLVDYESSSFFIYKDYTHNLGYITIHSKNDYEDKKTSIKKANPEHTITVWSEKIMLKEKPAEDLFEIGLFDTNIYISDRLAAILAKSTLSGFDIKRSLLNAS